MHIKVSPHKLHVIFTVFIVKDFKDIAILVLIALLYGVYSKCHRSLLFPLLLLLILRRASLNCFVTHESYYRSPIVQDGLEILCKLHVRMFPTAHNRSIVTHFETLVSRFYAEPDDEVLMGLVEQKGPKKKVGQTCSDSMDIRSFFKKN